MSSASVSGSAVVEYTHSESFWPSSITSIVPEVESCTSGAVTRYAKRRAESSIVMMSSAISRPDRGDDRADVGPPPNSYTMPGNHSGIDSGRRTTRHTTSAGAAMRRS